MITSKIFTVITLLCCGVTGLLDSGPSPTLTEKIEALTQKVEQLTQTVAALQAQPVPHGAVAFTAGLRSSITNLGVHQRIVFDHVITNIGNAYNPQHGFFTAPVSGAYAFFVAVTNLLNHNTYVQLIKNGEHLGHVLAHGTPSVPGFSTSTLPVTVHLKAGDEVWVRNLDIDSNVEEINGSDWSLFTGHLIAAD